MLAICIPRRSRALIAFNGWVGQRGARGIAVFIAADVAPPALFFPGSLLTIAARLAFLLGRYLARSKVEEAAKRNPKFAAMDKAITVILDAIFK